MPTLILVKHSLPAIDPGVSPREWRLSEEGKKRCEPLANRLANYRPELLFCSLEPKAQETALIVAEHLSTPLMPVPGLHEHRRMRVPFDSSQAFESAIETFFLQPGELIYGDETADEAHDRFANTVDHIVHQYSNKNLVVVTHGTVISLFVSRACQLDPFPLWKRLGLPALVVLSLPDLTLQEIVDEIV